MIALLAGTGALPGIVAARLRAAGEVPVICAMAGFPPEVPGDLPRIDFRIETFGSLLATLRQMGVTRACLVGAVRRPVVDPAAIDMATAPLVAQLQAAMAQGDDGTLRALIAIIEGSDMTVIGAHEIAPDLVPPAGVLTAVQPDEADRRDAALGEAVVAEMGRADLGQACVIREGTVLTREGTEGTDAMLVALRAGGPRAEAVSDPLGWIMDGTGDLLGQAADWLSGTEGAVDRRAGLLFKAPKPGQDRRADLPVIGPATAQRAMAAGLGGIVIEAGGVMVLDRAAVIATLDREGAFLWVRPAGEAA